MLQKLKDASKDALRARNSEVRLILSTLIGGLDGLTEKDNKTPIKNPTDAHVIAAIKKTIENNIACGKADCFENEYLTTFLPTKMSNEELTNEIEHCIATCELGGVRDMGKVMSYLNAKFAGLFDGKEAAVIAKSKLL